MGQDQSKVENSLESIQGLQVARILPHSPAHIAGLLPFFDIITAVDQTNLIESPNASEEFKAYIVGRENQQVCFKVFNLRIRAFRDVFCFPTRKWGGGGMLGCSIEWSRGEQCANRSFHVVDVLPDSSVGRCGEIKAEKDYIIGMQRAEESIITLLRDEDDFYERVEMWRTLQRSALQQRRRSHVSETSPTDLFGKLLFLVYDSEANRIKEVAVDLSSDVDAPLGMSLATGLLHLVPTTGDGNGSLPVLSTFVSPSGNVERFQRTPPPAPMPIPSLEAVRNGDTSSAVHPESRNSPLAQNLVQNAHFEPNAYSHPPQREMLHTIPEVHQHLSTDIYSYMHENTNTSADGRATAKTNNSRLVIPAISSSRPMFVPFDTVTSVSALTTTDGTNSSVPSKTKPTETPEAPSHEEAGTQPVEINLRLGNTSSMHPSQHPKQTQYEAKQQQEAPFPRVEPVAPVGEGPQTQPRVAHPNRQPPLVFPKLPPPLHFPSIRPATPTK